MNAILVRLQLPSGIVLTGKLLVRSDKTLSDTLNSSSLFLELESPNGERSYVAKALILALTVLDMPKRADLSGATSGFDPHAILGIERGATREAIRQAYLHITKKYHPDRFASIELPQEVNEYLGAMARRINAAYALLESDFETAAP